MYDHTFRKQVQISRSDIRPHTRWAVSLVILHMVSSIFLRGLCGYIWANILTLSPQRGDQAVLQICLKIIKCKTLKYAMCHYKNMLSNQPNKTLALFNWSISNFALFNWTNNLISYNQSSRLHHLNWPISWHGSLTLMALTRLAVL